MLRVTESAFSCDPVADMARARNLHEDVPHPDGNAPCIHKRHADRH